MSYDIISEILKTIETQPSKPTYRVKNQTTNKYIEYSAKEISEKVNQVSNALINFGVLENENIAIFSQNKPEWIIADLGIMNINCRTVPIYATNTAVQTKYLINDAEIRLIFVGDQTQYNIAIEIYAESKTSIEKIVVFDNSISIQNTNAVYFTNFINSQDIKLNIEADKRKNNIKPEDLATIIYTSGTTGEPKGVMISHSNFKKAFEIHDKRLEMNKTDHSLSFLPLTHVFERTWSLYCTYKGAAITFLEDPKKIVETLAEVKPTAFCSVPRLYQKAYHLIHAKAEESSKIKQKLFYWAKAVGVKQTHYIRTGTSAPLTQKIKYKIADLFLYKKVRAIFGGKMKLMPCAGAALSGEITQFFQSANLPVVIGYGLTETTASVSVFPKINYVYGTIGVTLPEIEVKLGAENEILVRGETVMKGYYKKPEETEKVFIEGWFKTGDAGEIDEFGNITLTDRIKDLMKTSGGKYISPQQVESLLTNDNFIEQAVLIGDNKPYATALLVPNFESLKVMAKSLNLLFANHEELVNLKTVKDFYETKLNDLQKDIAKHEKIKKFKLLGHEFSMHNGELTPTLKIKRKFVIEKFSKLIEEMYVIS